ncbi:alpha/beta fold hydrolase [Tessaracoccus sp. Z1128]
MDIILIPGLWLDGSSWDKVVPFLERPGHRVVALTPPGHDGRDPESVTYGDLVAAVVTEIDNSSGHVVLVGHSAGCAAAWAATDRRPDKVASVVLVGGFPIPHGSPILDGFEPVDGVVPFPGWAAFDGPDTADLDDAAKAELESHMTPAPGEFAVGIQELGDERRYDVPVVNVCTEYSADELRGWQEKGFEPVSELRRLHHAGYVDLESGHWPQASRPQDLAEVILRAATVR